MQVLANATALKANLTDLLLRVEAGEQKASDTEQLVNATTETVTTVRMTTLYPLMLLFDYSHFSLSPSLSLLLPPDQQCSGRC